MKIKNLINKWFKLEKKESKAFQMGKALAIEPLNLSDIENRFKVFDLEHKLDFFKPLIKSKIDLSLTPKNEENLTIGQSKIGGKPDLPSGTNWPKTDENKPLSFIAQLNCSEISKFDDNNLLPQIGLLSFFYCAEQAAWGFDPKDKDRFKIIYTDKIDTLEKREFPKDLEEYSIFPSNSLTLNKSLSLPNFDHFLIDGLLTDEESDNYFEISGSSESHVLGYSDNIQGNMELECQLVTNGLYCGDPSGYNNPKSKELDKGKKDWILLLEVDSEEKAQMMWGDMGKLYFWIKKQDLLDKNFEKSWFCLQCS